MKKKILLFTFLLVFNIYSVNAITIIPKNSEITNKNANDSSSITLEGGCSENSSPSIGNSAPASENIIIGRTEFKEICNDSNPYNVVIMVDNTGSMKIDNKWQKTNDALKTIVDSIKAKSPESNITMFKFNGLSKANDFDVDKLYSKMTSNKNYYKNISPSDKEYKDNFLSEPPDIDTNLQLAYKMAYRYLKESPAKFKKGYIPMVIILTDGYPTQLCQSYAVTNPKCGIILNDSGGPVNAYYTARTLSGLKKNLINNAGYGEGIEDFGSKVKIVTVGIGMDNRDEYVKFILQPNLENYRNLHYKKNGSVKKVTDLWTIESKHLYYYLENAKKPSDAKEKICRCKQAHEKILYDDGKDSFLKTTLMKTLQYGVNKKYYKTCTKKCTSSGYDDSKVKVEKFSSWMYEPAVDKNYNDADAAKIAENIADVIDEALKCNEEPVRVDSDSEYKSNYNEVPYNTNSINKTVIINIPNNLYFKVPSEIVAQKKGGSVETIKDIKFYSSKVFNPNANKKLDVSKGLSCIKINPSKTSLSLIVTESSEISLGTLSDVTYTGSGFSMKDAGVTNTVSYEYSSSTKVSGNSYLNLNITTASEYGGGYLVTGKEDDYRYIHEPSHLQITSFSNVGINNLYTDSNCQNGVSESTVISWIDNGDIWNNIDIINPELDNSIETVDSNDKDKLSNVKTSISPSTRENGSRSKTFSYGIALNRACISNIENTYNGTKITNGTVVYLDSVDGACGNGFKDGRNEDLDNLYYIPIDYEKDVVNLKVDSISASSVSGISIDYSLTCPIVVKRKELKFNYRTIDLSSPFPKSNGDTKKIPSNWKDWYSSAINKSRLSSSYNKDPIYVITVNKYSNTGSSYNSLEDIINYTEEAYPEWFGMNDDGRSSFICGDKINFTAKTCQVNTGSFCELGRFGEYCDN